MTAHAQQSFAMSTVPVDIAVFAKDRRTALIVEVKDDDLYPTAEAAAGLRRCLMKHGFPPEAPFFMLATPIRLFLWRGDADPSAHPLYSASAKPVMDHYCPGYVNRTAPDYGALEIVILFWLSDVAEDPRVPTPDPELDRLLFESGLYDLIRGGTADFDVQL